MAARHRWRTRSRGRCSSPAPPSSGCATGSGLIDEAAGIGPLAEQVPDSEDVYVVPAFTGLGSPWWDPYVRGTITGLTRGLGAAHIARAVIEAMAFQVRDVVDAMKGVRHRLAALRVDGGAAVLDLLLQIQADQLRVPVSRPTTTETTALGAATLAGWPKACGRARRPRVDLDLGRAVRRRGRRRWPPIAPTAAGATPSSARSYGRSGELSGSSPRRHKVSLRRPSATPLWARTLDDGSARRPQGPEGGTPGSAPAVCHRIRGRASSLASPPASPRSSPWSWWRAPRSRPPTPPPRLTPRLAGDPTRAGHDPHAPRRHPGVGGLPAGGGAHAKSSSGPSPSRLRSATRSYRAYAVVAGLVSASASSPSSGPRC